MYPRQITINYSLKTSNIYKSQSNRISCTVFHSTRTHQFSTQELMNGDIDSKIKAKKQICANKRNRIIISSANFTS